MVAAAMLISLFILVRENLSFGIVSHNKLYLRLYFLAASRYKHLTALLYAAFVAAGSVVVAERPAKNS